MSLCLRCNKPCTATSVFCDDCKLLLNYRLQQGESLVAAAAHAITEVEQPTRRLPRPSRLAPVYDVSADIQRESTPHPTITKHGRGRDANQKTLSRKRSLADRWSSLDDTNETEADIWANHTDPLARRHLPSRAEAERIEKEYLQHTKVRRQNLLARRHLKPHSRIFFTILAAIALLVMVANVLLISVVFVQPHPRALAPAGLPTLTISTNRASIGQTVLLYIANFAPLTRVLLTHDIEEAVQTSATSPLLQVDTNGAASVSILVDDSWGPGFHSIGAEDVTTLWNPGPQLSSTRIDTLAAPLV